MHNEAGIVFSLVPLQAEAGVRCDSRIGQFIHARNSTKSVRLNQQQLQGVLDGFRTPNRALELLDADTLVSKQIIERGLPRWQ